MSSEQPKTVMEAFSLIRDDLARIEAKIDRMGQPSGKAAPSRASAAGPPASGGDDNPMVTMDPRDWKGESHKNKRYSDCPPEFLLQLAGLLDWFAKKNQGEPEKAQKDASRAASARRWADKLKGGFMGEPAPDDHGADPQNYGSGDDSDIPF